jgi:hypothetical protein
MEPHLWSQIIHAVSYNNCKVITYILLQGSDNNSLLTSTAFSSRSVAFPLVVTRSIADYQKILPINVSALTYLQCGARKHTWYTLYAQRIVKLYRWVWVKQVLSTFSRTVATFTIYRLEGHKVIGLNKENLMNRHFNSLNTLPIRPTIVTGSPVSVVARSKARSLPLGYRDRGFQSRSRHGCLSLCFWVVLPCVGWGLCDGLITCPKESYQVS